MNGSQRKRNWFRFIPRVASWCHLNGRTQLFINCRVFSSSLPSNLKEQKKTKTNHGYIIVRSQHNWNSQNWNGSIASPDDEINRLIQQSRHMPIFSDPLCWYSFGYLLSIAALQSYLLYTRIHNKATMSIVKDQSNNKCQKNKKQTTAYHWINR